MLACGLPPGSAVKNLPSLQELQETRVRSLGGEDPLEEGMEPTPAFLSGESQGQRSLAGYSPWVAKSQTRLKLLSTHIGMHC